VPRLSDIQIRDPFVLAAHDRAVYVLYGTTDPDPWEGPGTGFDCYQSVDLEEWEGPFPVFRPPSGFWGTTQFWAPEVHRYQGRYLMFATFADDAGRRGTQVLAADDPVGPFEPWSQGPVTPPGWKCLDGTLFLDEAEDPWIVYCHEWLQIGDGSIVAQRLSRDARAAEGPPITLFYASEAEWVRPIAAGGPHGVGGVGGALVTDGPFLSRSSGGRLDMLWSSSGDHGYAMGIAHSASGSLLGPWTHDRYPLWAHDGGHGMIVTTFDGRRLLVFHQPNSLTDERVVMNEVVELDGTLSLGSVSQPLKATAQGGGPVAADGPRRQT